MNADERDRMRPIDLRPLWIAGRFLTRLPFPDPGVVDDPVLGRALPWYPAIGLLIGLILATAAWLLAGSPTLVAAALVLCLWVWVTGALHLDGLADTADAWIGGLGDRHKTLAIMKDPASGPAGVTALVLVLVTKLACLDALFASAAAWQLVCAPLLARATLPLLFASTPYVRTGGLGMALSHHARGEHCRVSAALAAALVLLAVWPTGLLLVGAVAFAYVLLRRAFIERLGGFTGDAAGALVELAELIVLVVLALTLGR